MEPGRRGTEGRCMETWKARCTHAQPPCVGSRARGTYLGWVCSCACVCGTVEVDTLLAFPPRSGDTSHRQDGAHRHNRHGVAFGIHHVRDRCERANLASCLVQNRPGAPVPHRGGTAGVAFPCALGGRTNPLHTTPCAPEFHAGAEFPLPFDRRLHRCACAWSFLVEVVPRIPGRGWDGEIRHLPSRAIVERERSQASIEPFGTPTLVQTRKETGWCVARPRQTHKRRNRPRWRRRRREGRSSNIAWPKPPVPSAKRPWPTPTTSKRTSKANIPSFRCRKNAPRRAKAMQARQDWDARGRGPSIVPFRERRPRRRSTWSRSIELGWNERPGIEDVREGVNARTYTTDGLDPITSQIRSSLARRLPPSLSNHGRDLDLQRIGIPTKLVSPSRS